MILIYSNLKDPHALVVERILREELGHEAEILDLSLFPRLIRMSMRFGNGAVAHELRLPDGKVIRQEELRAVWWRRPQPFRLHDVVRDRSHRSFARGECSAAFNGFWLNSGCMWVNPIEEDRRASRKPHQLQVARSVGLEVPDTLVTNDPQEARAFWEANDGQVVFKAFLGLEEAWRETRLLEKEDLALVDNVRFAPLILQRYVPPGVDLRVTVIGDRIFPAEIESGSGTYPVDVRMDMTVACRATTLPNRLQSALLALMDTFGLEYGAIDMRRTDNGRYAFLEVNPAGQYLYVERLTGMPISRALAEHLVAGNPRRRAGNQPSTAERTGR